MATRTWADPFMWGEGGAMLSPQEVARRRQQSEGRLGRGADYSPVGHWTQGLARMSDSIIGAMMDKSAGAAEKAGQAGARERFEALMGGGGSGAASGYGGANPVAMALAGGAGGGGGAPMPRQDPLMSMGQDAGQPLVPNEITPGGLAMGVDKQMGLPDGIIATAASLGMSPVDLATIISYETAGTFDPTKRGPTTQWGQHRGLIQFGEPQAQEYGVNWDDPLSSQLGPDGAVSRYFRQNGWQPGMGLLDAYSIVNAGAPGRYNASDANNGGAPGTVADKVNNQMAGHREKAMALLGGGDPGAYLGAGGQYSPVVSAMASGPSSRDIMALMSDPWVAEQYGPVLQALAGQASQQENAIFQQQLAQQDPMYQAQLAQLTTPQQAKPIEVGGVLLDPVTFQPIFDSRQPGADGFTLSPGQLRFDAAGNQIATGGADPGFTMIPPDQAAQMGLPPGNAYQIGADGKISQIGGNGTTVNVGAGETKFDEAMGKADADVLTGAEATGLAAQRSLAQIGQLETLLANSPTGASGRFAQIAGEWGIPVDGTSDVQAAQAIINALVPAQRPPGSGPMSDADLELFKQSLPRIINTPEGNATILRTMRGLAEYDAQGAEIVGRMRSGEIDRAQALAELRSRKNPLDTTEDDGWSDMGGIKIRRKN